MSAFTYCPFTGKRGYVTRHNAEKALRKAQGMARKRRQAGVKWIDRQERRAYGDCECGRWHLTSMREGGVLTYRTA